MKFSHTNTKALHAQAEKAGPKAVQMLDFALLTLQVKALAVLLRGTDHQDKVIHTFSSVGAFTMAALNISPEEFDPVLAAAEKAVLSDTAETMRLNGVESKNGEVARNVRVL